MLKLNVKDTENKVVSKVEVPKEIFDYPLKEHLIYEAVKSFRANQRSGNACTKNRANVSGSKKKLWKQKGTGRARPGSILSPLRRGGGTIFGPQPRSYSYNLPKKARRNALKSILSDKLRNEALLVVDKFDLKDHKTKNSLNILKNLELSGKKILVVENGTENKNLFLSARNLRDVKVVSYKEVNVYDTLKYTYVIFSLDGINSIVEVLK